MPLTLAVNDMLFVLVSFLLPIGVVVLILTFLSKRNTQAEERLARLNRPVSMMDIEPPSSGGLDNKMKDILDRFSSFSKPLQPKSEYEVSQLRARLANAGFRGEKAVQIYLGIRFVSMIIGFIFLTGLIPVYWTGNPMDLLKGMGGITLAGTLLVGLFLPEWVLSYLIMKRKEAIFLALPDVLDLMVVCVESGLGLDAAMRKVCEEMKDHHPVLTEEMNIANFQLQMGRPKRDVLHDLGVRTGVDDMRALAAILIQADRFGSSVAQALRIQSDSLRTRRRQIAEEKAAKTAVKLIFPLVLFIFPGIFVVLAGPAVIKIAEGFKG
jgi:tight adherence protein C